MAKNTRAKTRSVDEPYEIFTARSWEWRVLKHYQSAEAELKNEYARVFCAVKSPFSFDSWEYGDVYCHNIPGYIINLHAIVNG